MQPRRDEEANALLHDRPRPHRAAFRRGRAAAGTTDARPLAWYAQYLPLLPTGGLLLLFCAVVRYGPVGDVPAAPGALSVRTHVNIPAAEVGAFGAARWNGYDDDTYEDDMIAVDDGAIYALDDADDQDPEWVDYEDLEDDEADDGGGYTDDIDDVEDDGEYADAEDDASTVPPTLPVDTDDADDGGKYTDDIDDVEDDEGDTDDDDDASTVSPTLPIDDDDVDNGTSSEASNDDDDDADEYTSTEASNDHTASSNDDDGTDDTASAPSTGFDAVALRETVRAATADMEAGLRVEYGKYYKRLFSDITKAFTISDASRERLVRRMTRKLAEASVADAHATRPAFTWATGGHSAAAGHGNLFSQSFTRAMEETLAPVLGAAGLGFEGRNYGMGAYDSAPELSLCMEAVYGSDVDVLSWEFGMIDSKNYWKLALWAVRGGDHPNRPVLALLDGTAERWNIFQDLEKYGVGAFKEQKFGHHLNELPDYMEDSDPPNVPPALQYFVCNAPSVEEHKCNKYKYDTSQSCKKMKHQVSWHPGWKSHQLRGRFLAVFMVSILHECLDQLVSLPSSTMLTSESVLDGVRSAEDADRKLWPHSVHNLPRVVPKKKSRGPSTRGFDIAWKSLYGSTPMCSTALLPARTRFDGLVTGVPVVFANGSYDSGRRRFSAKKRAEAIAARGKNVTMQLVADDRERPCANVAERDYKDYFFVVKVENPKVWHIKKIPNDAEYAAFATGRRPARKNLIVICLECTDKKFSVGELSRMAAIRVDDVPAEHNESIGRCTLIMPSKKERSWTSRAESKPGQYQVQIQMRGLGISMKISSFVVIPFIAN